MVLLQLEHWEASPSPGRALALAMVVPLGLQDTQAPLEHPMPPPSWEHRLAHEAHAVEVLLQDSFL